MLNVRVTPDELARYKAQAKSDGYPSMSEWARHRLNEASSEAVVEAGPEASGDAPAADEGDG